MKYQKIAGYMKRGSRFAIENGLWGGCFDRMKIIRKQKNGREESEKTKMGKLNVDKAQMGAEDARLIGALIGLARATDGNTVRTEETGRLMRAGLAVLTHGKMALSERAADVEKESGIAFNPLRMKDAPEEWEKWKEQKELCEILVEKIHAEKRILAPDCATCGAPCGKTADYDINQWKKEAEPVQEQKILLLKRLVEVAVACDGSVSVTSAAPDLGCAESSERMEREPQVGDSAEIDYFLTKALFALGESWEAEWIAALVKEADHLITD